MPRIQDHLPKLSWIAADRLLLIGYGLVALLQIRALPPAEYGLYALLVSIQTWVFVLADGLVLQGIVQFGADRTERPVLDGTVAVLYVVAIAVVVGGVVLAEPWLTALLGEPRFAGVVALEAVFCAVTVPRTFCLRLLQRDVQTRQMFWIDAVWIGSMSIATVHGIATGWLRHFASLAAIAIGGIALSSVAALWVCRGMIRLATPSVPMARRLLGFGVQQMSASAIHTSVRQLDVVLAQAFFGTAVVGTYQAAKTIFRLFEVGADAASSVLYPAAVAYYHKGDRTSLHALASKAISVLSVAYVAAAILVWLGGDLVGAVLGHRYAAAVGMLRVLALAGIAMPLAQAGIVLIASGRSGVHAAVALVAATAATVCFVVSGSFGAPSLFPFGVVAYYAILGTGDWWALRRFGIVRLGVRDFFRSIPDALSFVRGRSK
jgi:O-antigen/teichoic acid export membrane protein